MNFNDLELTLCMHASEIITSKIKNRVVIYPHGRSSHWTINHSLLVQERFSKCTQHLKCPDMCVGYEMFMKIAHFLNLSRYKLV